MGVPRGIEVPLKNGLDWFEELKFRSLTRSQLPAPSRSTLKLNPKP